VDWLRTGQGLRGGETPWHTGRACNENAQVSDSCLCQHGRRFVRPPTEDEPLDPAWRPIDPTRDAFEDWAAEDGAPWPNDHSVLCWWLPTVWRRNHSAS
jgi:hypothetical protein